MRTIYEPSLRERTTMRLGGRAIAEIWLENFDDVERLPACASKLGGEWLCIGRGSNILADDGRLPIVLIRVKFGGGMRIISRTGERVIVRADCDANLSALLRFCVANELSGLEGLCGVPGNAGGAVAMNAGSFGTDIYSSLAGVLAYNGGKISYYQKHELSGKYRQISFPGSSKKTIVLQADFALTVSSKNVIFNRMRHNFLEKKSRQPLESWSAGCAFKNPPGNISAGKMLEMAGFRGKGLGGMAFSARHANFLINEGNGSAAAAFDLLAQAEESVHNKFDIALEKEIKIVP